MYEEKIIPPKKAMPQAQDGTLRKFALRVPEVIYQCSGIMVFGKRIKSLVFSTDLSIIKNVNADAIIAVYPFPVVVTVARADTDFDARLQAGANIFNVSAAAETPAIVRSIRERYPDVPIIATGGPTDESILETIRAGANAITWTPPSNGEIFRDIMAAYRDNKPHP